MISILIFENYLFNFWLQKDFPVHSNLNSNKDYLLYLEQFRAYLKT